MHYHQLTPDERYALAGCRLEGVGPSAIAVRLERHRSTIWRELRRNRSADGGYRPVIAERQAQNRRRLAHRPWRFTAADLALIGERLSWHWSPEQIAGRLRREGRLQISHETIYQYVWADKRGGGALHTFLRCAQKKRRKRYGSYERRGRVTGKRPIGTRPAIVDQRGRLGDWEIDTVLGDRDGACILSMVERRTGFVAIGYLTERTTQAVNRRAIALIRAQPRPVHTITADNGTEFHRYPVVEAKTAARFYFATPHHAWERGTNENTNGLIRQFLPKRQSMAPYTQRDCAAIAQHLNQRPRKRLEYRTPEECYVP